MCVGLGSNSGHVLTTTASEGDTTSELWSLTVSPEYHQARIYSCHTGVVSVISSISATTCYAMIGGDYSTGETSINGLFVTVI